MTADTTIDQICEQIGQMLGCPSDGFAFTEDQHNDLRRFRICGEIPGFRSASSGGIQMALNVWLPKEGGMNSLFHSDALNGRTTRSVRR
eukprot:CAMPEP_0119325126 /NCGR_PEP_ID=MMETSP1333-20130426/65032_1 /TAXON_ID=418940 /ORGANISM="Scyphosphaera apsteinii, Strain RCC1455" /LENGTH=88 /DNA_ID=CAMNT_0007333015 /DNA_START=105 /DNA_END=371 /DNA_ORIENTATION=+